MLKAPQILVRALSLVVGMASLAACGQRGPLYLPMPKPQPQASAPAQPAPSPAPTASQSTP
ncbi:LPS translocon maturation chaperone LptM [Simplicispira sedimenti]|uniref:LPS translocon maturation chaperone LptM n=1 Tax=Simplicispira sedimenti TaxID=2919500 RepID=UPI00243101D7|nr:lipoprotein [Acidovorax sp. W1-6]